MNDFVWTEPQAGSSALEIRFTVLPSQLYAGLNLLDRSNICDFCLGIAVPHPSLGAFFYEALSELAGQMGRPRWLLQLDLQQ